MKIILIGLLSCLLLFAVPVALADAGDIYYFHGLDDGLSLAPELMLIIFLSFFFYFAEKKKSFVLYCITTVISVIAGVYYLGWELELTNRVIGIALILFSVYTSFLALSHAFENENQKQ